MFVFCSWDDANPDAEPDIRGKDYEVLINLCFRYCRYFSLSKNRPGAHIDFSEEPLKEVPIHPGEENKQYFFCSDDARSFLLQKESSVFSWMTWGEILPGTEVLPEDLCFYREDGSVFFWSATHKGVCALCPKPGEDVSGLLSLGGWFEPDINGVYGVPFNLAERSIFL